MFAMCLEYLLYENVRIYDLKSDLPYYVTRKFYNNILNK